MSPGLGAPLSLEQPPGGAGVGISDVNMPIVGEGYDSTAAISDAVHKAYGEPRPVYAASEVGGLGYPDAVHRPVLRHVSDIGDGRLLVEPGPDGRQPGRGSAVTVLSPSTPRRGLLARLFGRRRLDTWAAVSDTGIWPARLAAARLIRRGRT